LMAVSAAVRSLFALGNMNTRPLSAYRPRY